LEHVHTYDELVQLLEKVYLWPLKMDATLCSNQAAAQVVTEQACEAAAQEEVEALTQMIKGLDQSAKAQKAEELDREVRLTDFDQLEVKTARLLLPEARVRFAEALARAEARAAQSQEELDRLANELVEAIENAELEVQKEERGAMDEWVLTREKLRIQVIEARLREMEAKARKFAAQLEEARLEEAMEEERADRDAVERDRAVFDALTLKDRLTANRKELERLEKDAAWADREVAVWAEVEAEVAVLNRDVRAAALIRVAERATKLAEARSEAEAKLRARSELAREAEAKLRDRVAAARVDRAMEEENDWKDMFSFVAVAAQVAVKVRATQD
jgi:hypothetical protein